ncbi:MAG: PKD domain-containing protein [Gemmatimonadaceae bacterium]
MLPTRRVLRAPASVALVVMLFSTSACEFFTTKPFAPNVDELSYADVPNVLSKYSPELPPTMYARASAFGGSLSTGSLVGDAVNGLRLSAAPLSPLAVDLASVTPAEWVSELGTGLTQVDDDAVAQALPFAFSFYGQSYSSVYVNPNGHISFGGPVAFKRSWNLPDGDNVIAAPAYADWMPASRFSFQSLQQSRVYVNTVGEIGDRRFVVTWNDIRPCCSLSYPGSSFQLQLLERTGELVFAYREMQMIVSNSSAGIAANAQSFVRSATGAGVLALQGCAITYTPGADGYRESNSCAPAPVNVPPVVNIGGPYACSEGSDISMEGSATDENGDVLTYSWNLGDGTVLHGNVVSHRYVDNGTYPASLAVSDGALVTIATTRVDVANAAPSVSALESLTRFIGEPYNVSASLSDAGVRDAPWHWVIEWGDGTSSEGDATSIDERITASHAWDAIGNYHVRLTLTDKDGGNAPVVEAHVEVKADEVDIDIKPWHYSNRIYLRGPFDRLVAVAVLTNDRLDASTVSVPSLRLGSVQVAQLRHGAHFSAPSEMGNWGQNGFNFSNGDLSVLLDVDRDGDRDLLVVFDRNDLIRSGDLTPSTESLTLHGITTDGRKVVGTDAVQVIK